MIYEVIISVPQDDGTTHYARLEHKGRSQWKTKRIAQKHCREYRMAHLRDGWVNEA
jgi:hypothetical protein